MENQTVSSKPIMINNGVMLGIATILLNVVLYAMGKTYEPHWSVGIIGFALVIYFVIAGIKKYKEQNNGFLSLGEALKIGVGIAIVAGVISVIYTLIFTNFIEPEYFTKMLEVQEAKMLEINPNMSEEQIEMSIGMAEKMSGPAITSAISLVGSAFIGFIVSMVGGLIMQKKNTENY